MTRTSIQEYVAAVRGRYGRADKNQKGIILDEFCATTGYHRKSAIRRLCHPSKPSSKRRGRKREYGPEVTRALKVVWEATGRVCSKRLVPFLSELIPTLEHHGELKLSDEIRSKLLSISASTIDRLLAKARREDVSHPRTSARASSTLKAAIPVRTFGDWEGVTVGFLEADLVAHCGESTRGFYLCTLVAVDIVTSWTVCVAVWGKNQSRVASATDQLRRQLPFPMLGIDTDNGGEFINQGLWNYCNQHNIKFTRSRAFKKNDQAYVEQKNWTAVRRSVGYDRYSSKLAYDQLKHLYQLINLHTNFFQPTCKLVSKQRTGAKVHKKYDTAQTPYQRLLKTGVLDEDHQQMLAAFYRSLNPMELCRQIDKALEDLWKLAERNYPREAMEVDEEKDPKTL